MPDKKTITVENSRFSIVGKFGRVLSAKDHSRIHQFAVDKTENVTFIRAMKDFLPADDIQSRLDAYLTCNDQGHFVVIQGMKPADVYGTPFIILIERFDKDGHNIGDSPFEDTEVCQYSFRAFIDDTPDYFAIRLWSELFLQNCMNRHINDGREHKYFDGNFFFAKTLNRSFPY